MTAFSDRYDHPSKRSPHRTKAFLPSEIHTDIIHLLKPIRTSREKDIKLTGTVAKWLRQKSAKLLFVGSNPTGSYSEIPNIKPEGGEIGLIEMVS
jgi:hypothetical protein